MHHRHRPLFASLLATAVLACNGNGLGGTSTGLPGGSFYVSGKANVAASNTGLIGFFSSSGGVSADPYDLVVVDPSVTTVNRVANGGTWLPMATVSQWTTSSGTGLATEWAPRYLIYAQAPPASSSLDTPLYLLDLGRTSSTSLPTVGTRLSTATTLRSNICSFGQGSGLVLNDYPTPSNSWVTFRIAGADNSCGTLDNQTIAIPLTAGPNTAPIALGLTEPVEAMHDVNGALTGAIELVHIQPSQVGINSPTLQVTDAKLNKLAAIGTSQPMSGTGNTTAGSTADFQSLGIAPTSMVWLYMDGPNVKAINLASPAVTTTLFTLGTSSLSTSADVLQTGKALFDSDGTTAYVAVSNAGGTSHIVRINTSASPPTATTVVAETAVTSIQLVGLTAPSGYLVYVASDQLAGGLPSVRATLKTASNSTTPFIVITLNASQVFDTEPPAVLGNYVYYTLDNNSGASPNRQLYSAVFSSGGVSSPVAFTVAGGGCTVMIRPVYPSPVSTTDAAFGSVLLASSSNFCNGTSAALAYANALLISVDSHGTSSSAGQLPQLAAQLSNPPSNAATALQWVDFGYFFGEPTIAAPVDGPLQAGMTALLELDGSTSQSVTAVDVELFTPGSTGGPIRLTRNLP
jgi:hypothetical protein